MALSMSDLLDIMDDENPLPSDTLMVVSARNGELLTVESVSSEMDEEGHVTWWLNVGDF